MALPNLCVMLLATATFWSGRHRFVHIPPGGREFLRETFSRRGLGALGRLVIVYLFVAVFWSLFDQTGSSWVLQAGHTDNVLLGIELVKDRKDKAPANAETQAILQHCLDHGLIFQVRGVRELKNVIRLVPPMTTTKTEVDRALSILHDAFRKVAGRGTKRRAKGGA